MRIDHLIIIILMLILLYVYTSIAFPFQRSLRTVGLKMKIFKTQVVSGGCVRDREIDRGVIIESVIAISNKTPLNNEHEFLEYLSINFSCDTFS